jgi:hypothetical protein
MEESMPTQQGSVAFLADPVAQRPIGFHWNGTELVLGMPPEAPKMQVLRDGAQVALTIDSDTMPYQVLLVRGSVRTDIVAGIAPEYAAMTKRVFGEEGGEAWLANLAPIMPRMARVFITPAWVGTLDFETRFPNALERAMERAQGQA